MKNALKISSLALLALVTFSCSTENDLPTEVQQTVQAKSSIGIANSTEKLSVTQTTVLAESTRFNAMGAGASLVLNYGNVNLHLDLQHDCNLVLYASPIHWVGSHPNPARWASNTVQSGSNNPYLSAQGDGNLVLYKNTPYISSNSLWATNSDGGNVSNPQFKIQIIKKKNQITGNLRYYATFILEGNNSERHEIAVVEITDIYEINN
ncbi:MAG: hypothetical protein MUW56_16595 [Chryseobacterium sp.]|uniref:hypothetical protein n=1 Tax=Chryseobacterium sp. TaxID=1871047 RepID=UPI0025C25818|nr:hypothetical protein [Chryseobacterium sp.]MCJ7935191.1 hypothetical protein [Chryseobacterium sp.]